MSPPEAVDGTTTDTDRFRRLLGVGRRLTSILEPDELHRAIYEEAASAVGAPSFYLALLDQSRDLARVVLYVDEGRLHPADVTFRGSDASVFRTQTSALVVDGLEDAFMVLGDTASTPRSAITAPVKHAGRILGALSAQSPEPDAYDANDLAMLEGIADVASIALRNSLQFQELERRRAEAEEFEAIGRLLTSELDITEVLARVTSAVRGVVAASSTSVWLRDPSADDVYRVEESDGRASLRLGLEWSLDPDQIAVMHGDGHGLMIDDVSSGSLPDELAQQLGSGSLMAAPVTIVDRVEGLLVASHERPHHFSLDDARALHRIATQFAVALENARLHADLQAASLTDPLTGLPNRRRLQLHLEHEVAAARRGRILGLAVMDIDRFKYYNDTFGHVAGDDILKALGAILKQENRAMNIVGRYGGDEFVSVLSGTELDGARLYAQRVGERVADDPTMSKFGITVSIGVAQFDPENMATVNDVLRAADSDMYRVKESRQQQASG